MAEGNMVPDRALGGGIPSLPARAKRSAGAGRGFVNPQRTDQSDEDYVTPKQRYDMERDIMDAREAAAAEKAYNKATGMKKGGSVSSASKRADGIAIKGKTRGTIIAMCGGGMYKK